MFGKIYKITNKINGKLYIGQTWQPINKRFKNHINDKSGKCPKLFNALNKYGWKNFKIEILTICHTQPILDYWESFLIKKYDSISNGYNLRYGGSRGKHSQESKNKISNSRKGMTFSEDHVLNISKSKSGSNNPNYGKPRSQNVKDKISKSNKGKTSWLKGKKLPEETKQKISRANNGRPSPFKGISRARDVCQKISLSHKGKTLSEKTKERISKANKKFSQEEEMLIYNMYLKLNSSRKVSKVFGCSRGTVMNIVKRRQQNKQD